MRSPLHSEQYTVFLEEFRDLRIRANLSQADLALKLGVGQDIVSRCESGRRRVDVLELQHWAEACGSSLVAFVRRLEARKLRNQHPVPLRPDHPRKQ
jgi:transcriptional regulator with XRE-family HTH domain